MVTQTSITRRGYVDAPTGQVHYRQAGPQDGQPLLLLHQSPSSSMMFERAYPLFAAAGIRAIGMDTPGFGMSSVPETPPSIQTYASVVPSLLDALGLDKVAVLGFHTGACTATEFAASHPDRVTHLVLAGPPLYEEEERLRKLNGAHRHGIELQADGSHLMARWNRRIAATPGWTDLYAMHRNVLQTLIAGDTEWYGHVAAFEYLMEPAYRKVQAPILILTNTGDDIYHLAQRAKQVRPEAAWVALEGGTHDIVDEQSEAWTQAVIDFIRA